MTERIEFCPLDDGKSWEIPASTTTEAKHFRCCECHAVWRWAAFKSAVQSRKKQVVYLPPTNAST